MKLSHYAGYSFVPVLSRIVLFLAFLPAGFHNVFHKMEFEGERARILSELGEGEPVDVADRGSSSQGAVLASWSPQDPPAEDPAEASPGDPGDGGNSAPLEAGDAPAGTTPDWVEETRNREAGLEPPPPGVVKARALHSITVDLVARGWKTEWRPQYMAWAASVTMLLGGALLFLGLFSRLWGLGLAICMGFAFYLTSVPLLGDPGPIRAIFAIGAGVDDYFPYYRMYAQLALLVLSLGIFLTGPGALSADRVFFSGPSPEDGLDDVDLD